MKQLFCIVLILSVTSIESMNTPEDSPKPLRRRNSQLLTPPSTPRKKETRPPAQLPQINVTVSPNISSTNDTTVSNRATNSTDVTTRTHASSLLKTIRKKYKKYAPGVYQGILSNSYYIVAGCCVLSVGYIYCQFLAGNRYLKDPSLWSLFRSEIPLETLHEDCPAEFIEELLLAIHRKYISQENPLNTIEPMAKFLQDVDQEHHQLIYYLTLYNRAKRVYAHYLFPANEYLYLAIPTRLQRLALLKDIFIGWASHIKTKSCHLPSLNLS